MFQEMKESKENEIFGIKQIKNELEQRITSLLDGEDYGESWYHGSIQIDKYLYLWTR